MSSRRIVSTGASELRLRKLITERLAPGADRRGIDDRIWDLFGEEWTVMFTDLSGFSRGVAKFGIIHFLQTIYESDRVLLPVIERHDGILLKVEGDSYLVIFRSPAKAVRAALDMQRACADYNADKEEEDRVLLCVGIGHGLVLRIGDADVFGAEVNAASKLGEDLAEAGDVFVTKALVDAILDPREFVFEELPEAAAQGVVGRAYRARAAKG